MEEVKILPTYSTKKQDDTGAPGTVYVGYSSKKGVADSDEEWAVQRITVAGAITTEEWARLDGDDNQAPLAFAWADRATLTYG